jgi:hypothetical protein
MRKEIRNTKNTIFSDKLSLEKPLRENQFYRWGIILNFSKSRDTKFLASHWQNSDNLPIPPADIPPLLSPTLSLRLLLTLQDSFAITANTFANTAKCSPRYYKQMTQWPLLYYSRWNQRPRLIQMNGWDLDNSITTNKLGYEVSPKKSQY